jgi:putative tryptophan/tyrosine transport system substrate-binding protein
MKRAAVRSILVAAVLLAVAVIAEAQQVKKVPRIGYLTGAWRSSMSARTEAFRQGLRELGYVEGKTLLLSIEWPRGK